MTVTLTPAKFTVEKEGRKWFLLRDGFRQSTEAGVVAFKTRHLAELAAAEAQADADGDAADAAAAAAMKAEDEAAALAAASITATVTITADLIAKMTQPERVAAARLELAAVLAWGLEASPLSTSPATPVLNWMTDPSSVAELKTRARKESTVKVTARTPEQDERIKALIIEGRSAGTSWYKIALAIEAEGIPTSRGGKWYDTTVSDLAKSLDLIPVQTPEVAA